MNIELIYRAWFKQLPRDIINQQPKDIVVQLEGDGALGECLQKVSTLDFHISLIEDAHVIFKISDIL